MQRRLSQRQSVLLGLFHLVSLFIVASTAPALHGSRGWKPRLRRTATTRPTPNDGGDQNTGAEPVEDVEESCRCAADQWEGVLRSVDRAFYLAGQDFDQPARPHLRTAEMESNSAIHYDFRNGLFASHDLETGVKTIIDYNMGIQYVVEDNKCRVRPVPVTMSQMCLPDFAQLDGKFRLRNDEVVEMYKAVGERNSTLRATVSLKHCLPVSEETSTLEHDYALVTSSSYVDVQLGINDRRVFEVPAQCRRSSRPGVMTSHDERPAASL